MNSLLPETTDSDSVAILTPSRLWMLITQLPNLAGLIVLAIVLYNIQSYNASRVEVLTDSLLVCLQAQTATVAPESSYMQSLPFKEFGLEP